MTEISLFNIYPIQEPLKERHYRVRGNTTEHATKTQGATGSEREVIEGTRNLILSLKQGTNLYPCSKHRAGVGTGK